MGECVSGRCLSQRDYLHGRIMKADGFPNKNGRKQCIHIAVAFDRNYLHPFYSLLASLIQNHERGELQLHVIADGVQERELNKITCYVEGSGNAISYYGIDHSLVSRFVLPATWTAVAYYRLFFPGLIVNPIRRLLYLDCDTIVTRSLRSLYQTSLGGHPVGAVYDTYVRNQPLIGIEEGGEYFNSGVLLIDIEEWERQEISKRAAAYLTAHPEHIIYVDQCALNAVLRKNWKKLDSRFNLMYSSLPEGMEKKEYDKFLSLNVVIHFTLQRPWQMLCKNRFRKLYFHYLECSGMVRRRPFRYVDFNVKKIPAWLEIRLLEFYFDFPWLQKIWRLIHAVQR
jgi:lipopolysaccharide biosynthesis glycosyltransferase